jgi:hypothetical protein
MIGKQRIGQSPGDSSGNIYPGDLEIVHGKGMQPAQADSGGPVAPSRDQWTCRRFMIVLAIFPVVRPIIGLGQEKTMLVFYCRDSGVVKAFILGEVRESKQRPGNASRTVGEAGKWNSRCHGREPGLSAGHVLGLLNKSNTAPLKNCERFFRRTLLMKAHYAGGAAGDA